VQPPRQLDDFPLVDQDGLPFMYQDMEPKWSLLVSSAGAECDSACESKLYLTRQIHVALGKEFNRVRRVYISDSPVADTELTVAALSDEHPLPADFASYLDGEHRGLQTLETGTGELESLFPEVKTDPSTWYLVDPAGWVMMTYNADDTYKEVIADLKFLLKNSGG
jgi:cytochrome oxidase Cu insertion factor (SCO1/SenC/PrrC family)